MWKKKAICAHKSENSDLPNQLPQQKRILIEENLLCHSGIALANITHGLIRK